MGKTCLYVELQTKINKTKSWQNRTHFGTR